MAGERVRGALLLEGPASAVRRRAAGAGPRSRQPRVDRDGERAPVHARCRRPTGARTSSWPCWRTSCAIRSRRSATRCTSCRAPTSRAPTHALGARRDQPPGRPHGAPDRRPAGRLAHRAGQGGGQAGAAEPGLADRALGRSQLAASWTSRDQQLRVELPEEPVVLDGDPVRLAQVLSNLINNAAKFSPQDTPHRAGRRLTRTARCAITRARRRRGHRPGLPAAHLRPVRAGRPVARPLARRPGHRPDAGQAPGRTARRLGRGRAATGLGQGTEVTIRAAGAARRSRTATAVRAFVRTERAAGGRAAIAHPGGRRPGGVGRDADDAAGDGRLRGADRQRRHGRPEDRAGLPARRGAAGHRPARA